jgi:hypothetical protein
MPTMSTVLHPRVRAAVSLIRAVLRGVVCVRVVDGVRLGDGLSPSLRGVMTAVPGGRGVVVCVVVVLAHGELPSTVRIRQMRVRPERERVPVRG